MQGRDSGELRVLVVEPEYAVRKLLVNVLEPLGDVVAVAHAADAETLGSFDVAVVDEIRYRESGWGLNVPLVILTTLPDILRSETIDLRHPRVTKPFSPKVLVEVVRRAARYLSAVL